MTARQKAHAREQMTAGGGEGGGGRRGRRVSGGGRRWLNGRGLDVWVICLVILVCLATEILVNLVQTLRLPLNSHQSVYLHVVSDITV